MMFLRSSLFLILLYLFFQGILPKTRDFYCVFVGFFFFFETFIVIVSALYFQSQGLLVPWKIRDIKHQELEIL